MPVFIFLAIITFTWGIGNVLVKKGFTKLSPWQTYALDSFYIALPMWLIYGIINYQQIKSPTLISFVSAIFITIVYAVFYYTINHGQIGLTSPIIASYPVFTLVLAYLFLGERLNFISLTGIILASLGIILISSPTKLKRVKLDNWVYLAISVAIGYGIGGYLGKLAVNEVGNTTYLLLLAVFQVLVVLIWRLFIKEPFPKLQLRESGYSFMGIVLFNMGNIVYYVGLEKGLASIIVPLSNTYITVTVILSLLWLKEKISRHQLISIGCIIIGVILVGLNS